MAEEKERRRISDYLGDILIETSKLGAISALMKQSDDQEMVDMHGLGYAIGDMVRQIEHLVSEADMVGAGAAKAATA